MELRKILENLNSFDCKAIYKEITEIDGIDITNKQKILLAILMTADVKLLWILYLKTIFI